MQKLLDWFHVKPEGEDADALTVWHRLTLDQQRAAHEQFARGFEAYLFTGKAPSIELQGIFQRFRAWLVSVYRSLKALDVELSDDVRGVMDRMLATADQIETAEAAAAMGMLFKTPEEAAQFGIDWKAYHAQGLQASQDAVTALEARSLADMQWLTGARGRELKKAQKAAEDAFAQNQPNVEAKALKLHSENPAKAVEMLTKYTGEMAQSTMEAWGDLAKFLIVKHNDMVVKPTEEDGTFKRTETSYGASPVRPGYPEHFNRRVVKETGDRYLIK
jgi:hypothetical protein